MWFALSCFISDRPPCNAQVCCIDSRGPTILDRMYLAFIEFLASLLGSNPILTGSHMALQCAVPCKSFVTVWTLIGFFTWRWTKRTNVFQHKTCYSGSTNTFLCSCLINKLSANTFDFSSSPVCFRRCSLKWPKWSKCFSQYSHTCTFFCGLWFLDSSSASKWKVLMCCFKAPSRV